MCGIAGYDLRKVELDAERKAMLVAIISVGNDTRGGDAHSFWTPKYIHRQLGELAPHAHKLVREPVAFLHTRKATCGANTEQNAHAFEIGSLIGSHNGIIMNNSELNNKYDRNFEVDSMHLFAHLNEGRNFDDIHGYGTIEWVDIRKPERIYLCRLYAGDLAVAGIGKGTKSVKGVVWSSDGDHLTAALTAANLEFFSYKIETGKVYYVENGKLFISGNSLALAERNKSVLPDWRNGHWDQEDEDTISEMVQQMNEIGDEEETEVADKYQNLWEEEEEIRQKMLTGTSSTVQTLQEDGSWGEEYVKGKGWVRFNADGTVTEGIRASNILK